MGSQVMLASKGLVRTLTSVLSTAPSELAFALKVEERHS